MLLGTFIYVTFPTLNSFCPPIPTFHILHIFVSFVYNLKGIQAMTQEILFLGINGQKIFNETQRCIYKRIIAELFKFKMAEVGLQNSIYSVITFKTNKTKPAYVYIHRYGL